MGAELRAALKLVESMRGPLRNSSYRVPVQEALERAYAGLIQILSTDRSQPSRMVEAFEFAKRTRSRTFPEPLSRIPVRPPTSVPESHAVREHELIAAPRLIEDSDVEGSSQAEPYAELRLELDDIWSAIEKVDSFSAAYVGMRRSVVVAVSELKRLFDRLARMACKNQRGTRDCTDVIGDSVRGKCNHSRRLAHV